MPNRTIRVSEETYKELSKLGDLESTYNEVIRELLLRQQNKGDQ